MERGDHAWSVEELVGLLNPWEHGLHTDMATYYKPSRWRGKRLVYRSTDPDEPKREMVRIVTFLVTGIILLATVWLLSRWTNP